VAEEWTRDSVSKNIDVGPRGIRRIGGEQSTLDSSCLFQRLARDINLSSRDRASQGSQEVRCTDRVRQGLAARTRASAGDILEQMPAYLTTGTA
jgi:hypothetical protein